MLEYLGPYQPGGSHPARKADNDHDVPDARFKNGNDGKYKKECRETHHEVNKPHYYLVDNAAEIPRDRPEDEPDQDGDADRYKTDEERYAGTVKNP